MSLAGATLELGTWRFRGARGTSKCSWSWCITSNPITGFSSPDGGRDTLSLNPFIPRVAGDSGTITLRRRDLRVLQLDRARPIEVRRGAPEALKLSLPRNDGSKKGLLSKRIQQPVFSRGTANGQGTRGVWSTWRGGSCGTEGLEGVGGMTPPFPDPPTPSPWGRSSPPVCSSTVPTGLRSGDAWHLHPPGCYYQGLAREVVRSWGPRDVEAPGLGGARGHGTPWVL